VPRPDDPEVPSVQRRHLGLTQAVRHRDDGSIDTTQTEIGITFDQFSHPMKIRSGQFGQDQVTVRQGPDELRLDPAAGVTLKKVADLGDDGRRNDHRSRHVSRRSFTLET
jgi:hypothetical protein